VIGGGPSFNLRPEEVKKSKEALAASHLGKEEGSRKRRSPGLKGLERAGLYRSKRAGRETCRSSMPCLRRGNTVTTEQFSFRSLPGRGKKGSKKGNAVEEETKKSTQSRSTTGERTIRKATLIGQVTRGSAEKGERRKTDNEITGRSPKPEGAENALQVLSAKGAKDGPPNRQKKKKSAGKK